MIEFENPAAFFLLLLIPSLYFLRYLKLFSCITFPLTLGDWEGECFEWNKDSNLFFKFLVHLFGIASYVCLVLAYAEPVIHNQQKVYSSRGSDIVFVVDTSPSMAASDIAGLTRLEAAKQAIHTLVDTNSGDAFGLIEMGREAVASVPPTMDRKIFFEKIDELFVGGLGDGTAIGTGLGSALFHLESSLAEKKSIVLITDGENNAGNVNPYTVAHLIASKGISLYVLGIGTRGSVPLEYVDPNTGKVYSGYLQSEYDVQALSKIATEADGKFFNIETLSALSQAFSSVSKNESVVQSYRIKTYDTEFYSKFLLFAFGFFVLAWIIRRIILQEVL